MNGSTSRRDFVKLVATSSGALVLGFRLDAAVTATDAASSFEPSAWLSIFPDGSVLVKIGKSEMGQGVRTSLPMIVAEELGVDLSAIRIEQASPGPEFRRLGTGGSGSIMRMWDPLRQAGATARQMLTEAAARRWRVEPSSCTASGGFVDHKESSRRASYRDLVKEAAELPVPETVELKSNDEYSVLGRTRKRVDAKDIVTGRATYGLDVRVPGMVYAVLARPRSYGATLNKMNEKAAMATPGVIRIIETSKGVAVVATSTWAALEGREALATEWKPGPGSDFDSDAHLEALHQASKEPAMTIHQIGDGVTALASADETIEAVYEYPFEAHAPVEPVNCTVLAEDDKCTIWSPTQTPNSVQAVGAHVLGLDASAVKVNVMMIGGGFGRRLGHDFDHEAIEIASHMKGTPVQLVWSREDDMKHGYFQAASVHRMGAGFTNGKVSAWLHRTASSPHNARRALEAKDKANPDVMRGHAWGAYDAPYAIPSMTMSYRIVDSPVLIGPWRAVFSPPSVFARECFFDEIAMKLDQDPIELRIEMLGKNNPDIPPTLEFDGDVTDRRKLIHLLERLYRLSGWSKPLRKGRARGIACNNFHTETYVGYAVEVSLRPNAREGELPFHVDRVASVLDCGVIVNPGGVEQQIESGIFWSLSNMKTEITFRDGAAQQSYFSDFPVAMIRDTPDVIDIELIEGTDVRPHGVGEPVVCPFAPAVANALSRLTGRRIRRLPVRAEDLFG